MQPRYGGRARPGLDARGRHTDPGGDLDLAGGAAGGVLPLEGRHAPDGPGAEERYVPLYEAKMIHQFDHRWATDDGANARGELSGRDVTLYRGHPVGSLLVWTTESKGAHHRGDGGVAPGIVKLLLDGQQRMTSLYGVIRGKAPPFFQGADPHIFHGLHFHLKDEVFSFYQPVKMRDDPFWIDVTALMRASFNGYNEILAKLTQHPEIGIENAVHYAGPATRLLNIMNTEFHIEEVVGADKDIDTVVEIFNRVNSGGTKLSKGDLALAKICAEWPEAREELRAWLTAWEEAGYEFTIDWLLRCVNTILTGEAKFHHLHDRNADQIQDALKRATGHVETVLNMIAGRLGLDHDRVLFGKFAIPVMIRYLDRRKGPLGEAERDKLLFWYLQAGLFFNDSASTETYIDVDLEALEGEDGGLDKLIEQLRLWHGALRAEPGHFTGWKMGARFHPVLYLLTRMGEARDWGTGLPLKASLLGKKSRLEVHHIFPKSRLYEQDYKRAEVNALANFCFLTKDTNLSVGNRLPEDYLPEIEEAHPGALASQWIPDDPELWKIGNFRAFLEARKELLAAELNRRMEGLLHGDDRWLAAAGRPNEADEEHPLVPNRLLGGIQDEDEERELVALNDWMAEQRLPKGILSYDFADPRTGEHRAIFDLAWPDGIQTELSEPVAVLLNEESEVLAIASQAGFRCFLSTVDFKRYVRREILVEEAA